MDGTDGGSDGSAVAVAEVAIVVSIVLTAAVLIALDFATGYKETSIAQALRRWFIVYNRRMELSIASACSLCIIHMMFRRIEVEEVCVCVWKQSWPLVGLTCGLLLLHPRATCTSSHSGYSTLFGELLAHIQ
eukprot:4278234-Amphidinium_carterae.1